MTNITELAQRTDLLMDNALETAKQLRELSESTVADAIFESIVENENGKEIQFERPISDLAYAAFLKLERLVEALEKAQQHIARQEQIILNQDESLSIRRGELDKAQAQSSKWLEAFHKAVSVGARYEERIAELESQLKAAENNEIDARCHIAELEESNAQVIQSRDHYKRMTEEGLRKLAESRTVTVKTAPVIPSELHQDTQGLMIDFCTALAEKLYKAQLKYGYDANWKQDGWASQCQAHFHQHIAKGDPRDVAAYCAFMWWHGWSTKPAEALGPRTVTVKLPEPFKLAKSSSGLTYYYADEVDAALTAAGIKVEAE